VKHYRHLIAAGRYNTAGLALCAFAAVLSILFAVKMVFGNVGGLSAESDVRVDDLLVRRVSDLHNGVVCYVASQYAFVAAPHGRTIAISCTKP